MNDYGDETMQARRMEELERAVWEKEHAKQVWVLDEPRRYGQHYKLWLRYPKQERKS